MPSFRITTVPKPPGACILCGAFDVPLVECVPELELAGHGNVMVCATASEGRLGCLQQMSALVGMITEEEHREALLQLSVVSRRLTAMEAELRNLRRQQVVIQRSEYEDLVARAGR